MVAAEISPETIPLVDQNGKRFTLQELRGNGILISFVYTYCNMSRMCPLTVSLNKQLREELSHQKGLDLTQLFVTLDPAVDTPDVLKAFAEKRGLSSSDYMLATGTKENIADFVSSFGAAGVPGEEGVIMHTPMTVLLDSKLKLVHRYLGNNWSPEDVIKDIVKIKGSETSKGLR